MKTPIPGKLPPPIPRAAIKQSPSSGITPGEKARFIQMSARDYLARFGDRFDSAGPYLNLVLPELIKRSASLAQLQEWDRSLKEMIGDYVSQHLGRHSDYVFGILTPLVRKTSTLTDLKAWDWLVKSLVSDYKTQGFELHWCYVLGILPELIDRSSNAAELKAWDAAIKAVIASIPSDKEFYLRRVIPKMIKQATNPSQLEALAELFGG